MLTTLKLETGVKSESPKTLYILYKNYEVNLVRRLRYSRSSRGQWPESFGGRWKYP